MFEWMLSFIVLCTFVVPPVLLVMGIIVCFDLHFVLFRNYSGAINVNMPIWSSGFQRCRLLTTSATQTICMPTSDVCTHGNVYEGDDLPLTTPPVYVFPYEGITDWLLFLDHLADLTQGMDSQMALC